MKRSLVLALSCLLPSGTLRADDALDNQARVPGDFAAGLTLEIQPQLAAQSLLVPLEVYRGARPGLADLAVFDADGQPVPHALRALETRSADHREERKAPLFPLREQPGTAVSDLALHVERGASGTVIDVRSAAAQQPPAEAKVVAYIIDASKLGHDVAGVRLVLAASEANFTVPFKLEASDDLSSWRTLSSGAVIGRLQHQGQSVERSRIELIATSASFLRLSWPTADLPVPVLEAYLEFTSRRIDFTRARARIATPAIVAKEGAYEIDLGAELAVESVQPLLPENVLIRAALEVQSAGTHNQSAFQGQLYRLRHDGTELASPPISVNAMRARIVKLVVDPRASGLSNKPLAFEVQYAPDQLLFISHGPGPYLLAYGSHKDAAQPFDANQLLEFMTPAAREALPRESTRVIGTRVLAGKSARTAPPPAPSYRTPLLWAVLIAGAGTLLLMALRLLRKTG